MVFLTQIFIQFYSNNQARAPRLLSTSHTITRNLCNLRIRNFLLLNVFQSENNEVIVPIVPSNYLRVFFVSHEHGFIEKLRTVSLISDLYLQQILTKVTKHVEHFWKTLKTLKNISSKLWNTINDQQKGLLTQCISCWQDKALHDKNPLSLISYNPRVPTCKGPDITQCCLLFIICMTRDLRSERILHWPSKHTPAAVASQCETFYILLRSQYRVPSILELS